MKPIIDFFDISLSLAWHDLFFLKEHLDNLEKEIARLSSVAEENRDKELKELRLKDLDRDERGGEKQLIDFSYDDKVEVRLPLMFRGAFAMMLYASHEASVTDVARVLQRRLSLSVSIDDIAARGGFLERAKKYFRMVLDLDLCPSNEEWMLINILADIRNGYAHANGRLEMMGKGLSERIRNYATREASGIDLTSGYVIVSSSFAQLALETVNSSIRGLMERARQSCVPPNACKS